MTQNLPSDDAFAASGPSSPVLWERVQPWTTMPNYAGGGTEFAQVDFLVRSALYSGHFDTGLPGAAPRLAVATTNTEEDSATAAPADQHARLAGYAFRQALAQDVEVRANFYTVTGGVAGAAGWYRHFGVGARIQGGSIALSGDLNLERTTLNDGYWALRLADAALGYKWILFRVNAGVAARLAESPTGETTHFGYANANRPFTLRMTVAQDGSGDVEIHVYAGSAVSSPEVLVYTDSSASKITTSGQVGFCMSAEQDIPGLPGSLSAHACAWVEATNTTTSTLLFRDEWDRNAPNGYCRQTQGQNPGVHPGYSLACGWFGDLATDSDAYTFPGVRSFNDYVSLSGGRMVATPFTGANFGGRTIRSSRPATSSFDQHRTCTVRFPSAGLADNVDPRQAGIGLRLGAAQTDPNWATSARRGYIFWLRYSDLDASWAAGVYRASPLAASPWVQYEVLGFFDGLSGLSFDTDISLEFVLANADSPNQVSNSPQLKCKVAGTQVVFGAGSTFTLGGTGDEVGANPVAVDAGITIQTDGTLWDETSVRQTSGPGEGLWSFTPNNQGVSARTLEFDLWAEGSGSGPGGGDELAENDQASIDVSALFDETPGTISPSTVLTVPLTWSVTLEVHSLANVHELDSGHDYRGAVSPYQRRTWAVRAIAPTVAETDTLLAFWDARNGVEDGFHWTTPDEEDVIVHFADDLLATALRAPDVGGYSFRLEELR